MCANTAQDLLFRVLDDEGERKVIAKLTRDMQSTTKRAWEREARIAINAGIRALDRASSLAVGLGRLDSVLRRLLSPVFRPSEIRRITASVRGMYTGFKRVAANQLGVGFSFRQFDAAAVSALSREQPFWIGEFYTRQMSDRIRDIGDKAIVQQGLGRKEAAKLMRDVLKQDLSWAGGPAELRGVDVIPARFAGNVKGYSEIVVSNVANRGRNMGFLSGFNDAGIERFRWNSVLDERTSQICNFLDGREFAVSTGISLMERVFDADSPEDIKEITPWKSEAQVRKIAGKGSELAQSEALAAAGIMVPPAHGRCRSVVEAV